MCFFSNPQSPVQTQVPSGPVRNAAAGFSSAARGVALKAKGVKDTIFTSALGDTGFGSSVRRPTYLGQTAGAGGG